MDEDRTPLKIDGLEFENIKRTDHEFLRTIFAPVLKANDMAELKRALSDTMGKLNRLSLFKESSISIQGSDVSLDGLKLIFRGEEKRYRIKAGTEAQKNDIAFSFGGFWANLFGRGETLEANASYGTTSSTPILLSFKKPLFGDPDRIVDISFTNTSMARNTWQPFATKLHQFALSCSMPSKYGMHLVKSTVEHRSLLDFAPNSSPLIRNQEGSFVRSLLSHTLTLDHRNDRVLPTSGHYIKVTSELCNNVTGNGGFLKQELYCQLVRPIINGDFAVALSGHCGVINPLMTDSILFSDRFHMGGPNSLRGFQTNSLGPRDQEDCLGGKYISEAGLQLSFPFSQATKTIVRGHMFVNSGVLSDILFPFRSIKDHMHSSIGCGIGANLGGVRLELNACYPLPNSSSSNHSNIKGPSVQVGIGMDFL